VRECPGMFPDTSCGASCPDRVADFVAAADSGVSPLLDVGPSRKNTPAVRASTGIYIAVIAAAIGLATVTTRIISPNNNFLASLLDVFFVALGVLALEALAYRRRRRGDPSERGTPTFLFTDIEGSTALLKQQGSRYPSVLARHERLVRSAVAQFGGRVIDCQGDSLFARFPTAREAVQAAATARLALEAEGWPGSVRMGIHTGASESVGAREFGVSVHRAARICALAAGGEILCSHMTHDLVSDEEDDLAGVLRFVDVGEHKLRGLDRPVRLYQIERADS
jgi:class 3 adenylate cyclase